MAIEFVRPALQVHGLSPAEKLVLVTLADYSNDDGEAWPSIPTPAVHRHQPVAAFPNRQKTRATGVSAATERTRPHPQQTDTRWTFRRSPKTRTHDTFSTDRRLRKRVTHDTFRPLGVAKCRPAMTSPVPAEESAATLLVALLSSAPSRDQAA
jgi:hypothetical protein